MTPKTLAFTALLTLPTVAFAQDAPNPDADASGALDADELAAAKQAGLLPMDDM